MERIDRTYRQREEVRGRIERALTEVASHIAEEVSRRK
jgi:hypothetical protein